MKSKRILAFFLILASVGLMSGFGKQPGPSLAESSVAFTEQTDTEPSEATPPSLQETEESTVIPEEEVNPDDVTITYTGKRITDDPKYQATPEQIAKEDPQAQRKPEQEEEIKNTIDVPSPPPVTQPAPPQEETTKPPATQPPTSEPGDNTTEPDTTTPETTEPTTLPSGLADGWHDLYGKRYLYHNGYPVTGWQTIGGMKYYFDRAGALSSKHGVDVSIYQCDNGNVIDWKAVKAAGIDFAMIRVGARGYGEAGNMWIDRGFVQNIENATAAGVECGVYFYSQARTNREAIEEAKLTLEAIKGYRLTYPIAIDIEFDGGRTAGMTRQQRTDVAKAFCETVKSAGYYPMIYASKSWLTDRLDMSQLPYDTWLANWVNNTSYSRPFQIWQYTDSGRVNGIKGNVDLNVCTFDYPTYLKANGWNHL